MKTTKLTKWVTTAAVALTTIMADRASADGSAVTAVKPEKHYTGTVVSADPKERVLSVSGPLWLKKGFNLGEGCSYMFLEKDNGAATDLRPGEKITVSYRDINGVLIADHIAQQPMRFEGMVESVNPATRTLTVRYHALDRTFQIANGCSFVLRNAQPGSLGDIQTGNHVTVTYETPGSTPTARQIAQTSIAFTGRLTAIDLEARIVKAKSFFSTKKFNLADNCAIVINGKPDGKLGNLKPNDQLVFNYDEINGVNVANRIAPVPADVQQTNSVAASTPLTGY